MRVVYRQRPRRDVEDRRLQRQNGYLKKNYIINYNVVICNIYYYLARDNDGAVVALAAAVL